RPAPARVRIDQQRQRARLRDAPDVLAHIVQRRDSEIREPKRGIRHPRPRKIQRAKPRAFREHRAIGIDRTRHLQRTLRLDRRTKTRSGRRKRLRHRRTLRCSTAKAEPQIATITFPPDAPGYFPPLSPRAPSNLPACNAHRAASAAWRVAAPR